MRLLTAFVSCLLAAHPAFAQWQRQPIGTNANFRGLCAVSDRVAWVSGTQGTFGRTTDGGKTWQSGQVPGAEKLDFRDVEALDENIAYLLSIGPGENSRIYKTLDGGKNWKLQFTNTDPSAFFDAIAFWDAQHGLTLSDPVDGRFHIIATRDGGASWKPISDIKMPPALPGEGAFAASGTCLMTQGASDAWFVTGGARTARVFHSVDRGRSWTASDIPLTAGVASAGAFSIAFRGPKEGIIVGGDYQRPSEPGKNAARTNDGGKTWKRIDGPLPFRSCIAWTGKAWLAAGTSGTNLLDEQTQTWKPIGQENLNVVGIGRLGTPWAAGPKGLILKLPAEGSP
jgi:photosystem II stability/assembly factor-like uncharacterized protein